MRVVVAGGTGFVGRAVAARLASDHEVLSLGLPGSSGLRLDGVFTIEADVFTDDVRAHFLGADAVIYAIRPHGGSATIGRQTLDAVRCVSAAAAAAGVRRWVQLSNVSVYSSSDEWVSDETDVSPEYPLGLTTLESERAARTALSSCNGSITCLRFGPVYALDDALTGASASYVEPGRNWLSFVALRDLADAAVLALTGALPDVCVVGDGEPVRAADAAAVAAQRRGIVTHAIPGDKARRFGMDAYSMVTSSVRVAPRALLAAGWLPTSSPFARRSASYSSS